jgi:hypothetical protein
MFNPFVTVVVVVAAAAAAAVCTAVIPVSTFAFARRAENG